MYSLIIPVYRNEESLAELCSVIQALQSRLDAALEVVFVVDGSPDNSFLRLKQLLPTAPFSSQLVLLSRNFGSFAAIRAGMQAARGEYFAVMAADLQEPAEIVETFFKRLRANSCDIVLGTREKRNDPFFSKIGSRIFWRTYRLLVQREMPAGGVDIFGVSKRVRDELLCLRELNTSLVGLLMWIGFRREFVGYERRARKHGKSAWTLAKKLRYFTDSIFAFSDLPIRILFLVGICSVLLSCVLSGVVVFSKLTGVITIPGYATTIILISFFSGFNAIGMGILGAYLWRTFENTKERPQVIVMHSERFN